MINNINKVNNKDSGDNKVPNENSNRSKSLKPQTFKCLKSKYRRSCYLLKKIEANKQAGMPDSSDIDVEIECHKVIEEYKCYLNTKRKSLEKPSIQVSDIRMASNIKYSRQNMKTSHSTLTNSTKTDNTTPKRDGLLLALVDEDFNKNKRVTDLWIEIEHKLSEMVIDYILHIDDDDPIPRFDSSKLYSGCRVIKCMDQFSKNLIMEYVTRISDCWEGLKITLIPAEDVPRRPRALICLPKLPRLSNDNLVKCLKLHNPAIPMDDWHVIRDGTSGKTSMSYLLVISEESVEALKKFDNKMSFGIRNVNVKIIHSSTPSKKWDDINDTSSLLEDINITDK